MICEICGRSRPLTYRSTVSALRSVCSECIRDGNRVAFGVYQGRAAVRFADERVPASEIHSAARFIRWLLVKTFEAEKQRVWDALLRL